MTRLASRTYSVRDRVKEITGDAGREVLDFREIIGKPLANDMRRWLSEQPRWRLCNLDFSGVRAVTSSVAEEIGPLLIAAMEQQPSLEHKYPLYRLRSPEPAYTVARAFVSFSLNCLALLDGPVEHTDFTLPIASHDGSTLAVFGQLTEQMEQILNFANRWVADGKYVTSDDLVALKFLAGVKPAARSKRLTELYARRLLAFRENPENPKERIFIPAWRLECDERSFSAQ